MKQFCSGLFFFSGMLLAGEGAPSAPPAYHIKSEQPRKNSSGTFEENSRNITCIDCRGAQFCCSGDDNGDGFSECPLSIGCCCSALTKVVGASADFLAEPDVIKEAQD